MYLVLVSVHGLIRRDPLELGRDADTGGQIQYVIELARSLAAHPQVQQVDLVTRLIQDPKVSKDYAQPQEPLSEKARIVRLPCGPRRYLRKEVLWPYLDEFADELLKHIRLSRRLPTAIHTHYADAGYVGTKVAGWLGIPLIHTGHSLGRVKRQRLLQQGSKPDVLEEQFHFNTRIEAEEAILSHAHGVVASTHQEVNEQYAIYDHYQPQRMLVLPPGIDRQRFHPTATGDPPIRQSLKRFLIHPNKPLILALSRPVPRKNLATLVRAYGEDPSLQERANLVLIMGSRQDIREMEPSPRQTLTELLLLIDRYDLYGKVAYPKMHQPQDVPDLYRLAVQSQGVFINPALTEPFGLTLIEAAACGLPVIAPLDGGCRDIITNCQNGLLIDTYSVAEMQQALHRALGDPQQWQQWSRAGIEGVENHYTWQRHVQRYVSYLHNLQRQHDLSRQEPAPILYPNRLATVDRLLVSDIDNTLIGDQDALAALMQHWQQRTHPTGFGVATGRHLESALAILQEWGVPIPDLLITSVGSEIHYGSQLIMDSSWQRHISYRWQPELVRSAMQDLPGITMQTPEQQRSHKISYLVNPDKAPSIREIQRHLRRHKLHVRVIFSHHEFLDLLPIRASKGDALRYCAMKWGIPVQQMLVAGDSGNDEQMLMGNTLAVVVGNHSPELEKLRGQSLVYFAQGHNAWGILEAIQHYQF
ncbi:MAG: HAD-IIB family hydrolase [Synechococcales cyanobacterium]